MPDASTARVLVIQTAFLGDVVLPTPLLELLARRHGAVDVVTPPAAAPLVQTLPAVRRGVPYDKHGNDRGLPGLFALARRLRAERYDVAYLPHRSLRTAALAWLARIPARVGYRDGWPLLYTEARARPRAAHEIDRLLALAAAEPWGERPSLCVTAADRATTEAFLREHGIVAGGGGGEPFVALAPGSIWGTKRWPHYRELSQRLAARAGLVVVGGPEDAGLGDEIVRAVGGGGGRGRWTAVTGWGRPGLGQGGQVSRP